MNRDNIQSTNTTEVMCNWARILNETPLRCTINSAKRLFPEKRIEQKSHLTTEVELRTPNTATDVEQIWGHVARCGHKEVPPRRRSSASAPGWQTSTESPGYNRRRKKHFNATPNFPKRFSLELIMQFNENYRIMSSLNVLLLVLIGDHHVWAAGL